KYGPASSRGAVCRAGKDGVEARPSPGASSDRPLAPSPPHDDRTIDTIAPSAHESRLTLVTDSTGRGVRVAALRRVLHHVLRTAFQACSSSSARARARVAVSSSPRAAARSADRKSTRL